MRWYAVLPGEPETQVLVNGNVPHVGEIVVIKNVRYFVTNIRHVVQSQMQSGQVYMDGGTYTNTPREYLSSDTLVYLVML